MLLVATDPASREPFPTETSLDGEPVRRINKLPEPLVLPAAAVLLLNATSPLFRSRTPSDALLQPVQPDMLLDDLLPSTTLPLTTVYFRWPKGAT